MPANFVSLLQAWRWSYLMPRPLNGALLPANDEQGAPPTVEHDNASPQDPFSMVSVGVSPSNVSREGLGCGMQYSSHNYLLLPVKPIGQPLVAGNAPKSSIQQTVCNTMHSVLQATAFWAISPWRRFYFVSQPLNDLTFW